MKDEDRQRRHAAISAAAYDLLAQHGYGGTSMLRVAKAAHASNETLYRWYGDKDGLFRAMVEDNTAELRRILSQAAGGEDDPRALLARVAPAFLQMLLGERAILLNRVAAADPTGRLGAAIAQGGREAIRPMLRDLIARIAADPDQATDWFLGLLVGDLQVTRIIHVRPALSEAEIASRCDRALRAFLRLVDG